MSKRGSNHTRVQKEGKVRDYYTCQACGSKVKPEGHHIIDYQYGGLPDVDNIITLCSQCHDDVHGGRMDVIKF